MGEKTATRYHLASMTANAYIMTFATIQEMSSGGSNSDTSSLFHVAGSRLYIKKKKREEKKLRNLQGELSHKEGRLHKESPSRRSSARRETSSHCFSPLYFIRTIYVNASVEYCKNEHKERASSVSFSSTFL